jgi:hypothetical protein
MPSRLSSLLVRDGLVGVKRMEKAFQRQVIYGGSLDTTLIEMGLVPEERLTQYLALTSGLPPANRAECNVFDALAVQRCGREVAHRYKVVPLTFDHGSLRVLVYDPVDMAALEELADELDCAVQPLIVPEYRWHVVFARTFGGQASARFSTLARQAEATPTVAPVGRARTVIVDGDERVVDVPPPPLAPVGPEAVTMRLTALTDEQAAAVPVPTPPRRDRSDRRVTQMGVAMPAPPPRTIDAEEPVAGEVAAPPIVARSRKTAEMATPKLAAHLAETEARRREADERRSVPPPIRPTPGDGVPTGPWPAATRPRRCRRPPRRCWRCRWRQSTAPRCRRWSPAARSPGPAIATRCSWRSCAGCARRRGGPGSSRCKAAPRSVGSPWPSPGSTSPRWRRCSSRWTSPRRFARRSPRHIRTAGRCRSVTPSST